MSKITPHSLRRTYASIRAAMHDSPVEIAEQLGHQDARFTFSVYQKAYKRRERLSGRYRDEFDAVLDWARMGTNSDLDELTIPPADPEPIEETASQSQERGPPGG